MNRKNSLKFLAVTFFFLMIQTPPAFGQGLTMFRSVNSGPLLTPDEQTIILLVIRLILVLALLIVGGVAFRAGYNWFNHEGSAKKRYASQKLLGKMLLVITGLIFLMAIYRALVPDYSIFGNLII